MSRHNALATIAERLDAIIEMLRNCMDAISSAEKRDAEKKDGPTEIRGEIWLPENIEKDRANEQHRQHTTQRWIAKGTWAATIAAIVYAGIAAYQTHLLHAANEQAKIQWEAEHRPWVGNGEIGFGHGELVFLPGNPVDHRTQADVVIDLPIKNVGTEPAFHVAIQPGGLVTKDIPAPANLDAEMDFACTGADRNAKEGQALFPNSGETKLKMPINLGAPFGQISDIHRVWTTICVAYSDTESGGTLHHTKIWAACWPITEQPREVRRTANPLIIFYSLPTTGWAVVKTQAD